MSISNYALSYSHSQSPLQAQSKTSGIIHRAEKAGSGMAETAIGWGPGQTITPFMVLLATTLQPSQTLHTWSSTTAFSNYDNGHKLLLELLHEQLYRKRQASTVAEWLSITTYVVNAVLAEASFDVCHSHLAACYLLCIATFAWEKQGMNIPNVNQILSSAECKLFCLPDPPVLILLSLEQILNHQRSLLESPQIII